MATPIVIEHLSFNADASSLDPGMVTSLQGVLWKRRDVFRNRWRPRWFVLSENQILTYYLLKNCSAPILSSSDSNGRASEISGVSSDVLPRGILYLGGGSCVVESNDELSRPSENLYALTIISEDAVTRFHLAARTPAARRRWIQQLRRVIHSPGVNGPSPPPSPPSIQNVSNESVQEEKVVTTSDVTQTWRSVVSPSFNLTHNVPKDLSDRIEFMINSHLAHVDEKNNPDWIFNNNKDGVHSSTHANNPNMIRCICATKHHPVDYLQFGWSVSKAAEIQTSIRFQKCLKTYNRHTCLVHTAYHAYWPTASRDFATVAHWRLLEDNQGRKAICIIAFSCSHADELQPNLPHHVRGTLRVSLNFWKQLRDGGCIHTRIISYDLNGNIPKALNRTIIQQQTGMPRIVDLHLAKTKTRECSVAMEYEQIYLILNKPTPTMTIQATPSIYDRCESVVTPPVAAFYFTTRPPMPSVWKEALHSLTPVTAYTILWSVDFPYDYVVFMVGILLALRWIVFHHLLQHYGLLPRKQSSVQSFHGMTTCCYFELDLEVIMRHLEDEAGQMHGTTPKHMLENVMLRALAQAMAQQPGLVARKYPCLPPLYSLDILVKEDGIQHVVKQFRHDHLTPHKDIQKEKLARNSLFAPSCQIQFESDANLICSEGVTVVVPGMAAESGAPVSGGPLSVTITMQSEDIQACRKFAEHVRRAILFQES